MPHSNKLSDMPLGAQARVGLFLASALLAFSAGSAVAAPAIVASSPVAQRALPVSTPLGQASPCAPDGFVWAVGLGDPNGPTLKDGEMHYCVFSEFSWSQKTTCTKRLPAEQYIRHKIGRPDAIYSGMAVGPENRSNIILFYCLPPRGRDKRTG